MTTSDALRTAWEALEQEPENRPGLYERRVRALSGFALFAGFVRPAGTVRLTFVVPAPIATDALERETRGFRVLRQYRPEAHVTNVSLELGGTSFRELFEVMAEDLIDRIVASGDEAAAVAAVRERLDRWERFMRAVDPEGLSREEQIGLYGELRFLRTLLDAGVAPDRAADWWHGPDAKNQDYQNGNRAVEVKTTTTNSSTAMRISNELQLDDGDWERLFLLHLWLKELQDAGTTLPMLVEDLREGLTGAARRTLDDRLMEAGYHDVHRALYERTGYVERERTYYIVEGGFPRVARADLRAGVSKVGYEIDLAGFQRYRRQEDEVIAAVAEHTT